MADPNNSDPEFSKENLIYRDKNLVVWLNDNLDVWWRTYEGFDTKLAELKQRPEWGEIMGRQTELEALPTSHLTKELKSGFRFQIGTAIFLLFTEKFEYARKTMTAAESFYKARTAEKARMWILESGITSIVIITVAAGITGWLGSITILPQNLFEQIMLGVFVGAWGAFASLVLRASALGIDATAGRKLHYMESICRIITGCVAGGIAICAVTGEIIAPGLVNLGVSAFFVLGFSAGFGTERFLPTLVGNVDSSIRSNKQSSGTKK